MSVNARGARVPQRRDTLNRTRAERAFRRMLDGMERDPALDDLLAPRGEEGWH